MEISSLNFSLKLLEMLSAIFSYLMLFTSFYCLYFLCADVLYLVGLCCKVLCNIVKEGAI